jgi:hypothetical protein
MARAPILVGNAPVQAATSTTVFTGSAYVYSCAVSHVTSAGSLTLQDVDGNIYLIIKSANDQRVEVSIPWLAENGLVAVNSTNSQWTIAHGQVGA